MNEKPKVIKVPDSQWNKENREHQYNTYEVMGSLDFSLGSTPYDFEGELNDLYTDEDTYKEGVEDMEEVNIESIPSPLGLQLNTTGVEGINDETNGMFLEFLKGGVGGRYILLSNRQQELELLRKYIPRMSTEFRQKFLEVFIENIDTALDKYGKRAILMIS